MSELPQDDAVEKAIVVRCTIETAFHVWTTQIDVWWPKGHSISGDPATSVAIEPFVGGRLYERTAAGAEHVWGVVTAWAPPRQLAYHWYLGSGPEQPSLVEVRFSAEGARTTRVSVIHRGPELLGERWAHTSPRFSAAWEHVLPSFSAACPIDQEERS